MRVLPAIFVFALAASGMQASVHPANPDRLKSFEDDRTRQISHAPILQAHKALNRDHVLINIFPLTAAPADGKSFYNEFSNNIDLKDNSNQRSSRK